MNMILDDFGVTFSEDHKILVKGNMDLEEYAVPVGTEVIGKDAWGKMDKLKTIHLPEGLRVIEPLAFSGCMGLNTVQLPSTLEEIGSYAFEFTMLRAVIVPEGITVLRNDVFGECFGLQTVVLPASLEYIEDYAFCSCPSPQLLLLTSNRKLKSIAPNAFEGSNAIFLVLYEQQKSYMEAFPAHSDRFFGVNIIKGKAEAEVFSPQGEVIGKIRIKMADSASS